MYLTRTISLLMTVAQIATFSAWQKGLPACCEAGPCLLGVFAGPWLLALTGPCHTLYSTQAGQAEGGIWGHQTSQAPG